MKPYYTLIPSKRHDGAALWLFAYVEPDEDSISYIDAFTDYLEAAKVLAMA